MVHDLTGTFKHLPKNSLSALVNKLGSGFGNAFLVLTNDCVYSYKLAYNGKYRDAEDQFTLKWNNPEININWPISDPILSKRDSNA